MLLDYGVWLDCLQIWLHILYVGSLLSTPLGVHEHAGGNWKHCSFQFVDLVDSWVETPNIWPFLGGYILPLASPIRPATYVGANDGFGLEPRPGWGRTLNGKQGQTINFIQLLAGQIITTSAEVTLNGGLVRESPQNPLNSGLGIILICPDF